MLWVDIFASRIGIGLHEDSLRLKNWPCVCRVQNAVQMWPLPGNPRGRTEGTRENEYRKSVDYYNLEVWVASLITGTHEHRSQLNAWLAQVQATEKDCPEGWDAATRETLHRQFSRHLLACRSFAKNPHWTPENPNRHVCCGERTHSNRE